MINKDGYVYDVVKLNYLSFTSNFNVADEEDKIKGAKTMRLDLERLAQSRWCVKAPKEIVERVSFMLVEARISLTIPV